MRANHREAIDQIQAAAAKVERTLLMIPGPTAITAEVLAAGARPVPEHPTVHLAPELAHLGAFVAGRQFAWLVIQGFNLLRHGEVLVSHGLIGDTRVDHCHRQRLMAEQSGDGIQAHAPIDGLGGQGVPKLVSRHMPNSGICNVLAEDLGNTLRGVRTVPFDKEPVGSDVGGTVVCHPIVEEFFELRMERDVSVVMQLIQRNPQPVDGANLHDGVDRASTEKSPGHVQKSHSRSKSGSPVTGEASITPTGERSRNTQLYGPASPCRRNRGRRWPRRRDASARSRTTSTSCDGHPSPTNVRRMSFMKAQEVQPQDGRDGGDDEQDADGDGSRPGGGHGCGFSICRGSHGSRHVGFLSASAGWRQRGASSRMIRMR